MTMMITIVRVKIITYNNKNTNICTNNDNKRRRFHASPPFTGWEVGKMGEGVNLQPQHYSCCYGYLLYIMALQHPEHGSPAPLCLWPCEAGPQVYCTLWITPFFIITFLSFLTTQGLCTRRFTCGTVRPRPERYMRAPERVCSTGTSADGMSRRILEGRRGSHGGVDYLVMILIQLARNGLFSFFSNIDILTSSIHILFQSLVQACTYTINYKYMMYSYRYRYKH